MGKVSFSSSRLGPHLDGAKLAIRLQQNGCVDVQEESWGKSDPWEDSVINLYQVNGPTISSERRDFETFFQSALYKLVPTNGTLNYPLKNVTPERSMAKF
jgi:hypothetical protein